MGLFDIFKKEDKQQNGIYSVANGTAIPLNEIPDELFSQGVLGDGIGIKSNDGMIYAPADCEVIQVSETKHAVGLKINDIELLIHVGIDTVELDGQGFEVFVKEGQKVKKGQELLKADLDVIKNAGYSDVVVVVMTYVPEDKNYKIVRNSGEVTNNELIIEI